MKGKPVRLARFATAKQSMLLYFVQSHPSLPQKDYSLVFKLLCFLDKEAFRQFQDSGDRQNITNERKLRIIARSCQKKAIHILYFCFLYCGRTCRTCSQKITNNKGRLTKVLPMFKIRISLFKISKVICGSFDIIHIDLCTHMSYWATFQISKVKEGSMKVHEVPKDGARFKLPLWILNVYEELSFELLAEFVIPYSCPVSKNRLCHALCCIESSRWILSGNS